MKGLSPRYERMGPAERAALVMGTPAPAPMAAGVEPPAIYYEGEEEPFDPEVYPDDVADAAPPAATDVSVPIRLPLLSNTARNQGGVPTKAPKLRGKMTEAEMEVRREHAAANAAAAAAKRERVVAQERSKLEFEAALNEIEERRAEAEAEAAKAARAAKAAKSVEASRQAVMPERDVFAMTPVSPRGRRGGISVAPGPALDQTAAKPATTSKQAASQSRDASPSKSGAGGSPSGGSRGPREKRATISQIDAVISRKVAELRGDSEELERLRKSIRDEKRAAAEAREGAPGYKPYVSHNVQLAAEWKPAKLASDRAAKAASRMALVEATARRHASLLEREVLETLGAARERHGDHWANGHWAVQLPQSLRSMPRVGASSSPRARGAGDDLPLPATLSMRPGDAHAWSSDTAKGRARRLAAQIARM